MTAPLINRLILLPQRTSIPAGRTVYYVVTGMLGPLRLYPGSDDIHPLQSAPEVIDAVCSDGYTVTAGEFWNSGYYAHGRWALLLEPGERCRFSAMSRGGFAPGDHGYYDTQHDPVFEVQAV